MTDIEEFEKWWCEHGIKFITEKTACFGAWQARQPEIDALKHKLAVTDDGFRAAEALLKSLGSENAALKAEVERLRKDAERYCHILDCNLIAERRYRSVDADTFKAKLRAAHDAAMKETK